MTQEEFNNLSQRFYKASKIQSIIFKLQEQLEKLDNTECYSYDGLICSLQHILPQDCCEKLEGSLKEMCRKVLQEQIKIHEKEFEEL